MRTNLRNREPEKRIDLQFSNKWLHRFKKRKGLCKIVLHGESAYMSTEALNAALQQITARVRVYTDKDIFNAEEFSLQYRM